MNFDLLYYVLTYRNSVLSFFPVQKWKSRLSVCVFILVVATVISFSMSYELISKTVPDYTEEQGPRA